MRTILAVLLLLGLALPAQACRLALVLAIDISNSVDGREYQIQVDGLADALLDPEVGQGLVRAQAAVTVMLWTGRWRQYVVVPWTRIGDLGDVAALSEEARAIRRIHPQSNTALARAVDEARALFADVPDCRMRTIDVSGDGIDNDGGDVAGQRALAEAERITINGLAIDAEGRDITGYFRDSLITRNGFVMTARRHRDYGETLRRKLQREVSEAMM